MVSASVVIVARRKGVLETPSVPTSNPHKVARRKGVLETELIALDYNTFVARRKGVLEIMI